MTCLRCRCSNDQQAAPRSPAPTVSEESQAADIASCGADAHWERARLLRGACPAGLPPGSRQRGIPGYVPARPQTIYACGPRISAVPARRAARKARLSVTRKLGLLRWLLLVPGGICEGRSQGGGSGLPS